MFVLRLIGKILLIPVWLILAIAWVMVHIAVFAFSVFHGFWKAFFVIMAILAVAFGLYQNALIFVASIAMTFFIVFAGVLIDVLLETARKSVGRMIVCGC